MTPRICEKPQKHKIFFPQQATQISLQNLWQITCAVKILKLDSDQSIAVNADDNRLGQERGLFFITAATRVNQPDVESSVVYLISVA